ncbi:MAG: glycoside hydrolase family 104 protein [Zoogloeaceae bacterium]|jgi:muramidase (phage lysozyme)|nr:glycoside hydrolase family 104 protein [Zoogloeaceae bacterium]
MIRALACLILLGAAYITYRKTGSQNGENFTALEVPDWISTVGEAAARAVDYVEGAVLNTSAMRGMNPALLNNANVKAFLRVIRTGEGTADTDGYRRIFGGQLFTSYADHPRIKVTKGGYTSTAAGAYQFLVRTWDETRRIMGLPDFSPGSQDLGALGRIAARNALSDLLNGEFESALTKCAWEWASLPGSPYGQPTITMTRAVSVYLENGGTIKK